MHDTPSTAWTLVLGRQAWLRTPAGDELVLDPLAQLVAARLVLDGPQPRESLSRRLWPETDAPRARANLRQRLLRLKTQAGRAWIDGGDMLELAADLRVQRQSDEPLLPELPEPVDDELAAWLHGARRSWQQPRREALVRALAEAEADGRLDDALARATECVALDPAAEQPRRALARVHYLRQDRARALAELDALDDLLQRRHGAPPSPATLSLRRLVLAQPQAEGSAASAPSLANRAAELPVSLLRPPRIVGREAERAQLREALDAGAACLLLGEAGLGKSRLIDDALQGREAAAGVKAQSGDAAVPYATLARLLRQLLAARGEAAAPATAQALWPLLSPSVAVSPAWTLPPDGQRLALLETLRALWQRLGLRVVAVDDLHFADEASLELLQALIGDERLGGVGWLLAQRPAEPGGASARVDVLLDGLADAARLQRLRLLPLDEPGVGDLLASLELGLDVAAWAPRLHRHTGGNPLFVLETLKQLQRADVADGRLPASASVEALIDRRLQRLAAPALALARLAALAGPDFELPLAEAVAGRSLLDLADAWNELVQAQVLREDGSFAHDLVLDAVRRGVPAPVARELHDRIAAWLAARAAAPARLAEHWERAGAHAEAGAAWRSAAHAAAAAGRHREEAAFQARAAESFGRCGDATARFEALCDEVDALVRADLGAESLARAAALSALAADDAQRLRALRHHVDLLGNRGQPAEAIERAQQAFALLDRLSARADADSEAQALAEHVRIGSAVVACHLHLMQRDEAVAVLDRLLGRLAASGVSPAAPEQQLLANAQANVAWISGRLREAAAHFEDAAAQAAALGQGNNVATSWNNIATCWARLGLNERAADAAERSWRQRRSGEPGTGLVQQTAVTLARARRDQGRFAEALALYDEAVAEFGRSQAHLWRHVAEMGLATTWARLGQFARAQSLLHTDDEAAPPHLRAQRRLARGDLLVLMGGDARPWLDEGWAVLRGLPPHAPGAALVWLQGREAAERWAEAGRIASEAHAADLGGVALAARVRQAEAALDLGRAADAEAAAGAALALLDEGRHPEGFGLPTVWWVAARAAQAAGRPHEAARRAAAGARWLRDVALPHVAPPGNEAGLTRHPVHRALLALQQALPGGDAP
ncbi:MAG: ATP-binding protein [Betaproteobacteria bacterium]